MAAHAEAVRLRYDFPIARKKPRKILADGAQG
jgi:hypothetical protein